MQSLETEFELCVTNSNYPASLEPRKFYRRLPDDEAAQHGLIRVIDESGEDYLYPSDLFLSFPAPNEAASALRRAS